MLLRCWHFAAAVHEAIGASQLLLKIAGGSAMTGWFAFVQSMPLEAKVPTLIAIFAGAFFLVGVLLHILRYIKLSLDGWVAKKAKLSEDSKTILATVEAIDNLVYNDIPKQEQQTSLTKERIDEVFGYWEVVFLMSAFSRSMRHGVEALAHFLDERGIGLLGIQQTDGYRSLHDELEQLLRLKSVGYRNKVHDFVRWSYGFNSTLFFGRRLKAAGKEKKLPIFLHLLVLLWFGRLENMRRQGLGNRLTNLSLELAHRRE